ncbi:hypothetical protein PR003_g19203 [Phytophthora rubi]|uniref:Uncharacterized protein n=1 Tax=Phytophthora rubi TaxID=129364 RepID=A0A6A4DYB2_9STRA|nr:hypothetical protein PR001_g6091 [Phytophthora rubi]KAE9314596.1 hypothetical protein PR003_g19203 [Phytophthora rubi]
MYAVGSVATRCAVCASMFALIHTRTPAGFTPPAHCVLTLSSLMYYGHLESLLHVSGLQMKIGGGWMAPTTPTIALAIM